MIALLVLWFSGVGVGACIGTVAGAAVMWKRAIDVLNKAPISVRRDFEANKR